MSEQATTACTCAGPSVNTHVDGNEGHNPSCPAHPHNRPHPRFLTGEDGEPIWILCSAFDSWEDGLRAYNAEFATEWPLNRGPSGDSVLMRCVGASRSPWGDDPEWHEQTDVDGPGTARYWRFEV